MKDGVSISLASNESAEKEPDNPCPIEWGMLTATSSIAMDRIGFPCIHGRHTHLDSFAHVFFDGKMWNGYSVADVVTMERGAAKSSILTMKDGIVTRGVLYDIARLQAFPTLNWERGSIRKISKPGRRRPE